MTIVPLCSQNVVSELHQLFENFDQACQIAQYRRSFIAGGCELEFFSNQGFYLPLVDRALKPATKPGNTPAKILSTSFGELGFPHIYWADSVLDILAIDALLKDTNYRLHIDQDHQVYSIFDHSRNHGIQLSKVPGMQPPWESGGPLRVFIHWYLARRGRTLVHAGTLAVGNTGILLAGPGGSGKSSTVISGIAQGLKSVGDDYISVETNGQVIVRPVFQIMKVEPARLAAIGVKTASKVNWQNKIELAFADFPWPFQVDTIEARALCLPKVAHAAKTRFEKIASKEAFLSLTVSALAQLPAEQDRLFQTGAQIARKLPCYAIHLGIDPAEIAESITSFITEELQ